MGAVHLPQQRLDFFLSQMLHDFVGEHEGAAQAAQEMSEGAVAARQQGDRGRMSDRVRAHLPVGELVACGRTWSR